MSRDISLSQAECVHRSNNAVGSGLQTAIEPWNAVRLPHIAQIKSKYIGMAGQKTNVAAPVSRGTHQSMQQYKRIARAGTLIVDPCTVHDNKPFFYVGW